MNLLGLKSLLRPLGDFLETPVLPSVISLPEMECSFSKLIFYYHIGFLTDTIMIMCALVINTLTTFVALQKKYTNKLAYILSVQKSSLNKKKEALTTHINVSLHLSGMCIIIKTCFLQ